MAQKDKKVKKSRPKNKKKMTKSLAHGKKLTRKDNFIRFLRVLVVIVLLGFIGLLVHYFYGFPEIKRVFVTSDNEDIPDLNDVIAEVANSIGVDENNYSLTTELDHIYIKLGINSDEFDLALVNSILTGKLEAADGILIKAKESDSGNYQLLEFHHPNTDMVYLIRLYYGKYSKSAPEVFLIIDDFGSYKNLLLDDFCKLDKEVNFAILPNEPYYKEVMEAAVSTGHDILIHIPMEPEDIKNNNPGKDAILVQYSPAKIKSLVRTYIERLPKAIAANNHMGSLATSQAEVMQPVLQELERHNLMFIDSYTSANSVVYQVAKSKQIKIWRRDMFLDDTKISAKLMEEKSQKLLDIAGDKNQIFVIGHCHSRKKLDFITEFINRAKANGFRFSAISKLKKNREVINA